MKDATQGSTPSYRGHRSFHDDPYHFCVRCGSRVHIKDLVWQRGLLVCKTWDCVDTGVNPLLGNREQNIARVLGASTDELQPDPKLVTPSSGINSTDDDIIF
jgi:hypothetical protein